MSKRRRSSFLETYQNQKVRAIETTNNEIIAVPSGDEPAPIFIGTPQRESKLVTFTKKPGTFIPQPQNFSLPSNIIYFMAKNPSNPVVYEKLIQSCKYFFHKNPIIVTNGIMYKDNEFWITNTMAGTILTTPLADNITFENTGPPQLHAYALSKMPHKLWLNGDFEANHSIENKKNLFQKIYKFDLNELLLCHQTIDFDDYLIMISSKTLQCLRLTNVKVKSKNGELVPLERLLEGLANLREIDISNDEVDLPSMILSETPQKLLQFPRFRHLATFGLSTRGETFDIETFETPEY